MVGLIKHFLSNISIVINNECNTNCIFCFFHSDYLKQPLTNQGQEISLKYFKQIIDRLKEYKVNLHFTSDGEPLLHSQIWKLIDYARPRVGTIEIITNLLNEEEDLLQLLSHQVDSLLVNLPAPTGLAYELQRPGHGGGFNLVVRNLKQIQKMKQAPDKPIVVLSMVLNKMNYSEALLRQYIWLAKGVGAHKLKITRMIEQDGTEHFLPDYEGFARLVRNVKANRAGVQVEFNGFSMPDKQGSGPSQELNTECTMTAIVNLDKSISFCCRLRQAKLPNFFGEKVWLAHDIIKAVIEHWEELCPHCPFKQYAMP